MFWYIIKVYFISYFILLSVFVFNITGTQNANIWTPKMKLLGSIYLHENMGIFLVKKLSLHFWKNYLKTSKRKNKQTNTNKQTHTYSLSQLSTSPPHPSPFHEGGLLIHVFKFFIIWMISRCVLGMLLLVQTFFTPVSPFTLSIKNMYVIELHKKNQCKKIIVKRIADFMASFIGTTLLKFTRCIFIFHIFNCIWFICKFVFFVFYMLSLIKKTVCCNMIDVMCHGYSILAIWLLKYIHIVADYIHIYAKLILLKTII